MPSLLFEDILKGNPWHDPKNGQFTSGPGGGASAWASKVAEEKAKVLAMAPNEQARYVFENGGETREECVYAMKNNKTTELVENYFAIMEANGDPTPTKPKSGNLTNELREKVEAYHNSEAEDAYPDYETARIAYVRNMTGQSEKQAQKTVEEMSKWGGTRWKFADTATLDKYIEEDHVYDGKIYRGMKLFDDEMDSFLLGLRPGAQLQMKRNSSWSTDEETAWRFAQKNNDIMNSVILTCVKNRTSAHIDHLVGKGEDEVLAHSKAKWTVLHCEVNTKPNSDRKIAFVTVAETGAYE